MATPIKRIPKEKVSILHVCAEEERLKRIELILVGNGHPEEGYIYKVIDMGKQIGDINAKLTGISTVVTELYSESTSKKEVIKTTREKRNEWIKVVMFIVGALSLIVLAYNSLKVPKQLIETKQEINKRIDLQDGVSKVTRSITGEKWVKYNDEGLSDSVKIK
jgi:hypothetical protein